MGRAAQNYQNRLRQDKSRDNVTSEVDNPSNISKRHEVPIVTTKQQQQHMYTSPISGLINRMTGYLAKTSLPNNGSNNNPTSALSIGSVADTCVLVDTLYL